MRRFGFVGVIYIDAANNIIAGHGRVQAAVMAGLREVPTVCIDGLSEDEIRAYIIADNQLAIEAGWTATFSRSSSKTSFSTRMSMSS
jgi:hypothetical protein